MKNILLILLFSTTFIACVEVKFEKAQPAKTKNISEFPKELQGNYLIAFKDSINELDTITIGKNYFTELNLNQQKATTAKKSMLLSDSLVLKKIGNNFVLNINEKDYWMVILLKPNNTDYDIFWIDGDNEATVKQLNLLTKVQTVKDENGTVEALILNPKKKEFINMTENTQIFTQLYTLKKIQH